jgi:proteasome lid subunit RPN8/RPN11
MGLLERLENSREYGIPGVFGVVRPVNNFGFSSLSAFDGVENRQRLVASVRELARPASHGGGFGFSRDDNENSHGGKTEFDYDSFPRLCGQLTPAGEKNWDGLRAGRRSRTLSARLEQDYESQDKQTWMKARIQISPDALGRIEAHALREHPNECCGLILGPVGEPGIARRLRECVNAQDAFHRSSPAEFPRTGRNAYFMDPVELLAIERERVERDEAIRVIYHSHCDADAYFSEEDVKRALYDGKPIFPDAVYLVISVKAEETAGMKVFYWRSDLGRFVSECGELARG